MIKDIQLAIADIDGTLTRDDGTLSEFTMDVLRRIHERGVLLGLATGREYNQAMEERTARWGFADPGFDMVIGLNGGQIWDRKTQYLKSFNLLEPEVIREIVEMMEPLNLNPFLYRNGKQFARRMDESTRASGLRNHQEVVIADDISLMWQGPTPKIMFRVPEEQMPEVEAWADAHSSDQWQSFKTQTTMLEFCDPSINKGFALKQYCEYTGIPLSSVMAFGDMTNDNQLLEAAGWGVCLKNGADDTKACADDVTEYTNNEDGLAYYLLKHVLKEEV